jgi:Protein of unknown function (DUF3021)
MKILRMMIFGLFFSLASSYAIITIIAVSHENVMYSGAFMLEEFLIAFVLGPIIGLGSLIFQIERFPFIVNLILHFIYVTVCVLIAGKVGGWYTGDVPISIGMVLVLVVFIYILVWLTLAIMTQRDIKEINRKIRKIREE